jgi:hypothetical protein
MAASIIAGLLGSLVGAILISGAIYLAFKLFRLTIPRFPNLWKSAFLASAAVVVVAAIGAELAAGGLGAVVILALALIGAFIAYDQTLETPEGERMGRKAATVALVAHSVFSILSFTFVFPVVMGALT